MSALITWMVAEVKKSWWFIQLEHTLWTKYCWTLVWYAIKIITKIRESSKSNLEHYIGEVNTRRDGERNGEGEGKWTGVTKDERKGKMNRGKGRGKGRKTSETRPFPFVLVSNSLFLLEMRFHPTLSSCLKCDSIIGWQKGTAIGNRWMWLTPNTCWEKFKSDAGMWNRSSSACKGEVWR